jgi:hypothetical protein
VTGVVVVAAFVWLGMVLGVSFLETPLRFRAPGMTSRLGLGVGRLVFAALNRVELGWAAVLAVALLAGPRPVAVLVPAAVAAAALATQLLAVRPVLTRHSDRVLAGEEGPRSHAHLGYVGLEVLKVVALALTGGFALAQL